MGKRSKYFVVAALDAAQGFTTAFGRAVGAFGAVYFRGAKAPRLIPKARTSTLDPEKQRQELLWVRFAPAMRICKFVRGCCLRTIRTTRAAWSYNMTLPV